MRYLTKIMTLVVIIAPSFFSSPPAKADFFSGLTLFQAGKYCAARDQWLPNESDGDSSTSFGLAELYGRGLCVKEDQRRASQLYLKSAVSGFARGCSEIGVRYAYGKGVKNDLVRAYIWLNVAKILASSWEAEFRSRTEKNIEIIGSRLSDIERNQAETVVEIYRQRNQLPDIYKML